MPTEEVRVQADASLVETTVTSLGKTVEEREVLDLPLNGLNFSQLGLLQPGVVPITPGLAQAGGSLRDGQAFAVNGQRPESNNFLIDRANNFNAMDGGLVIQLPINSIAEFRILTNPANAEFGHGRASCMNTSFNLCGEAIVNKPTDAVRTFFSSGMDAPVIGSFLVEK